MCGIAGYYHLDSKREVSPETLAAMAAIQYHRGPDDCGVVILPEGGIGMSHARLSIIGLGETGRQPLLSDDGELLLAHNGEFYDYKRIRATLVAAGYRFRSKSDSEIALHLYRRWGIEIALTSLRGEFAFALYDHRNQELHLVRDRFGIKPLYWTIADDTLIFGSEIKVLFAHPAVSRRFSAAGLYHQLMQTMVPGTTPYEGIHQVPPGQRLRIGRGPGGFQIEKSSYWDLEFPDASYYDQIDPVQAERESVEQVQQSLLEAVQLRLEADVPVGCYLSGGIDSCSIIGLAAAVQQSPVKAFTIGFDNDSYDESAIATRMAQSTGADQDILRLNANHLYDNFEETIWHAERTIYNTLAVAKLLMSRHVHQAGYRVVVTGEGSDELFAGYPSFRRDLILHGMDGVSEEQRKVLQSQLDSSNQIFKGAMLAEEQVRSEALESLIGFTPSCLEPWLALQEYIPDLLAPDLRRELQGYDPGAAIAGALDASRLEGRHVLDRAQYVWSKTMLEGQILTWGGDRMDMANSMEARPAFLDHHLAEKAIRIHPHLRINGRIEKYVLREAMKGILPEELYKREKFAFMAPPAHTDPARYARMKLLADEFLSPQAIAEAGLLDHSGVAKLFELFSSGTASAATQVRLDALVNHLLGVQMLARNLIARDIPKMAMERAESLGWLASAREQVARQQQKQAG